MKKMSFWTCMFMCIGSIIGAGIFARTPVVIRLVGNGLVWGFFLAAIFVFLKTIPEVICSSALPANGSSYMHLTRLMHPGLGVVHAFNQLVLGTMNVAIMSLTFAEYFSILVPSIPVAIVAIAVALLFTIISTYGVKASATIQNICVVILILVLGIFIFGGIPNVSITLEDVLMPSIKVTQLWAAMGLLHGCLIGANVLMYAADEVDNPGRTIPITFVVSTLICAALFAIVGFVSLGVVPMEQWMDYSTNLATAAGKFMSPQVLTLFIVGGPLLAVATSINALILMFSRSHFVAARDGLFPTVVSKMNKHNAPVVSIWLNSVIGILAIVAGFNLDDVVLMVSVPGLLMAPIIFFAVFFLPKKYPNCYKNSFLKIPHWIACVVVIVASVLSLVLGWSVVNKMTPKIWASMVGFYVVAAIYTVIRKKYIMKKDGVDIFKNMSKPYEPWEKREKELAKIAVTSNNINANT